MDIYLKKAILHMVDRESGVPVFSTNELDLTTEYIREYVSTKIKKVPSAQTKCGQLQAGTTFTDLLAGSQQDFANASQQLTDYWYQIYTQSEDGPSCDILIALYEQDTEMYLALLKLNYKDAYTHFVDYEENNIANKLILNHAILPSKTQKPDEGITVNLETLNFELVEKRYTFSGEKRLYFSEQVIEVVPKPSVDENIREIKKTAKKISKQFNEDEFEVLASVQEAVYETIEETGTLDSDQIIEKVFSENISARMAYKDELSESSFVDKAPVQREVSEKKFGKQKLKMSNGIELIVPMEVYRDADALEFVNNPDGTISVVIKNIEEIVNRL